MVLSWNPWALPNLVAGAVLVVIALFLLHVGAGRPTNRLLAAVFVFYGFAWTSLGLLYSHTDPDWVFATQLMFNVTIVPGILLYPAFIGHALTRAPRFLRTRTWLLVSVAAALLFDALMIVRPEWAIAGMVPVPFAWYDTIPGPLMVGYLLAAAGVALFGLVLSVIERFGTRPGTPARARANSFLLAFGIQDVIFFAAPLVVVTTAAGTWPNTLTNVAAGATASVAASLLVTYGILRHQLFDIEVHLRFAISRSTMAAVFVAVFFIASEAAQQFLGDTLGGTYIGIAAAGALVFALAPLQRAAERLAEKAVPRAAGTGFVVPPGTPAPGAMEVAYLSAVRAAIGDGSITRREEHHLAELAGHLGLSPKRALELRETIEDELRRGAP